MSALEPIVIALSCFSAIPMPFVAWNERNMRHMFAAFPLVGVIVGGLCLLWYAACDIWGAGTLLRGVGLALVPIAVTGGIHMDGLSDVADAYSSHSSPERRREILKDPHVGTFAIVGICSYLLAYSALASELDARLCVELACAPVVSRCLCGLASMRWEPYGADGMLASMRSRADVRGSCRLLVTELAFVSAAMVAWDPLVGACALGVAAILFLWTKGFALRTFGGMSGDICGFLVQCEELAMLACIVLVGKMV